MHIEYYGSEYDILDGAFYDPYDDEFDVDLVSATSTRIVLRSVETGYVTTLIGTGLVAAQDTADLRGTLSSIEFRDDAGGLIGIMTDISWPLAAFIGAIDDIYSFGSDDALTALLESSGPITVDASAATSPVELYLDGVGVPVTFTGSARADTFASGDGSDTLFGGAGNDYLDPGDNTDEDVVDPGTGNDTVDAWQIETGALLIRHGDLVASGHGLVFDIDGNAGTATITKTGGNGTTVIRDVANAMGADGLDLAGTASDDVFNVTVSDGGWVALTGGRGDDSFVLGESSGTVRLDYRTDNSGTAATQGLRLNLATGVVSNDGFGGTDSIQRSAPYYDEETDSLYFLGRVEVRGTQRADVMIGSLGDERFIPLGGNDNIDGGDGWDALRYDQNGATGAVKVDLAAGTALGSWEGTEFSQTIANIEEVRGTRDFGDMLSGSGAGETLLGRGGDDAIFADGFEAGYAATQAGAVYRLYQATLDRSPNAEGHANWTERLYSGEWTLQQVATGFVNSSEFQATYGAVDNAGFVELLYQNVLDRAADATGLANWTARLEDGMTRAQVVTGFSQSGEFISKTSDAADAFAEVSSQVSWSDDVYRLYQATLGRNPDATGFGNWTERLAEGYKLDTVINGFVQSAEFQRAYGALDNEGFVELLYQNVLERAADATGLANWTARLDGGMTRAEVVKGFSQSGEFVAATAADLKSWIRGLDHGTGDDYHDWLNGGADDNLLAGGLFADVFEFERSDGGNHRVLDLEAWDYVALHGFGYEGAAEALAHMTQSGSTVVFDDQGVNIVFAGTQLGQITEDMVLI